MPNISIIVPVYNSSSSISRCIDSIISQTYTDWELILIDDGSSDNSYNICKEYANQDARISVFQKSNGGVSSARNLGMDNATGERITFVDSDDEIYPNFLELAMEYDEDVVSGKMYQVNPDGTPKQCQFVDEMPAPASFYGSKDIFKVAHTNTVRFYAPVSMVWKRDLIKDIRFVDGMRFNEDTLFSLSCLKKVRSLRALPDYVYKYYSPDVWDKKYALKLDEAVFYLREFFKVADSIPEIDDKFHYSRPLEIVNFSKADVIKHPWSYAKNKDFIMYYNRCRLYWDEYNRKWVDDLLSHCYANYIRHYLRKIINKAKRILKSK